MGQATSIEWSEMTWNPATGCSKVSPGCAHCYAVGDLGDRKAFGLAVLTRYDNRAAVLRDAVIARGSAESHID